MQISFEVAEGLLLAFGVSRATRAYDRWKKPYGFDLVDFDEVLHESPAVFSIDWREHIADVLPDLVPAFKRCGFALDYEERADGDGLRLRGADGSVRDVVMNEEADFDRPLRVIQEGLPSGVEIRRSPENEGCDTAVYAVLRSDDWRRAEELAPGVVSHFFVPL